MIFSFLLLHLSGTVHAQQAPTTRPSFEELLNEISSSPGDPCEDSSDRSSLESNLFMRVDDAVVLALNSDVGGSPRARAVNELTRLEGLSAGINHDWQVDRRFHFKVSDLPPGLLVTMHYRGRDTFSVFAMPRGKESESWECIGAVDDDKIGRVAPNVRLELYPLQRGPSKNARFLAKSSGGGCAGSIGLSYYAYELSLASRGALDEFIKLEGTETQEEPIGAGGSHKDPLQSFPPAGELRTQGSVITLPYCKFSAVDSWDNPTLCWADSYDLSGDRVQFVSSVSNRPDLLPIAKAIEYAQEHDFPAVLAYCGSADIAAEILRDVPPFVFASPGLEITALDSSKEKIGLGDAAIEFEVEKRGERWLVVSFRIQ